jgi:hypothetical protein
MILINYYLNFINLKISLLSFNFTIFKIRTNLQIKK